MEQVAQRHTCDVNTEQVLLSHDVTTKELANDYEVYFCTVEVV